MVRLRRRWSYKNKSLGRRLPCCILLLFGLWFALRGLLHLAALLSDEFFLVAFIIGVWVECGLRRGLFLCLLLRSMGVV